MKLTHAMRAPRSRTAAITPSTFEASTIVIARKAAAPAAPEERRRQGLGEIDGLRLGRHGFQAIPTGKIVVDQPGSRTGRLLSELQRGPLAAQPICFFHGRTPASESTAVSLCHRA